MYKSIDPIDSLAKIETLAEEVVYLRTPFVPTSKAKYIDEVFKETNFDPVAYMKDMTSKERKALEGEVCSKIAELKNVYKTKNMKSGGRVVSIDSGRLGYVHISDHAELYRPLCEKDLEALSVAYTFSIDSSKPGFAYWDTRNEHFEIEDGKGKKHKIKADVIARENIFVPHLIGMAGGLSKHAADSRNERYQEEIEEKDNEGCWGWAGRHKKATAGIIGGTILLGALGGLVSYGNKLTKEYNEKYEKQLYEEQHRTPTPSPTPVQPVCVQEGKYIEYEGIKICEPKELQDHALKALKGLKQYNPEDFEFVKQFVKVISIASNNPDGTPPCFGGNACAVPGDKVGEVNVNPELVFKGKYINGCTFVHEAEHLKGNWDEEIPKKHAAECDAIKIENGFV